MTGSPSISQPHPYQELQPIPAPRPITAASSSTTGSVLPLFDFLENSLLVSSILEEILQDLSHSDNIVGHQETLPYEDVSETSAEDMQHLKDVSSPSSATPAYHQTLINPLLPPLLPILLSHSFLTENIANASHQISSDTQYEIPSKTSSIVLPAKYSVMAPMEEKPLSSTTATDDFNSLPHFFHKSTNTINATADPGQPNTTITNSSAFLDGFTIDTHQASTFHPKISTLPLDDSDKPNESSLLFSHWLNQENVNQTLHNVSGIPSHRQPSKYTTPSTVPLYASTAPFPELFEVLTSLQHRPTNAVHHHAFNSEEKYGFDGFPSYLTKNLNSQSSLPSLGNRPLPYDANGMENEHYTEYLGSNIIESVWKDLLHSFDLEALLTDLDMDDPYIRKILRLLAVNYIFAINPHLQILSSQYKYHESVSISQAPTPQFSPATERVLYNSSGPGQGENKPLHLSEVVVPHSIVQKNDFPSSHHVEVTSTSAPVEVDSFLTRIEAAASTGSTPSSGISGAAIEENRVEECLKKKWCALGMALTMAAGTTSAMAVPIVMPVMGR